MPKKIIFIEPTGKKTNVFDHFMKLPLTGTLYLATLLHHHGYEVKIYNENLLSREIDPFELNADIFCITSLTVSAVRAKLLAIQLKTIYPESKILMGGIHASLLPQDFQDVADHLVIGEAEDIIVDLVEGKFSEKIVKGVRTQPLDDLPLINFGLLEGREAMNILPLMTSRGCPYDCTFCAVTKIFGKQFRMQSPKRILAEIENTLSFFKSRSFFFYDDNFVANKERINDFCDLILEKKMEISWAAQVRTNLASDPALIDKMARAGLHWVCIGFESINNETLTAFHKQQTQTDIVKAIKTFHQFGVNIHGMFIIGEDHDTLQDVSKTVDFAMTNRIDTLQLMLLTPFPSTPCYEAIEKEGRFFHKNWDFYNGMFIVFQPKKMNALRLMHEIQKAYVRFYSLKRTFLDLLMIFFNVFIDALVWNFKRADSYNLDIIFMRGGAKLVVDKYSEILGPYIQFLEYLEKKKLTPGLGDRNEEL